MQDAITAESALDLITLFEPFAPAGGQGTDDARRLGSHVSISRLAGYDDVNFRVTDARSRRAYVLKIHNAADSAASGAVFHAHNAVMQHIAAAGLVRSNTPMPLADGSGFIATVQLGGGGPRAVRLLTFLEGDIIGPRRLGPELQRALGAFIANLVTALQGFDDPALHDQTHDWFMECAASTITRKLPLVQGLDQEQRRLIESAAARLQGAVCISGDDLPRQVCHADANENNLLISADASQVTGILDWGDAAHCWRVVELAVAAAYAALLEASQGPGKGEEEGAVAPGSSGKGAGHEIGAGEGGGGEGARHEGAVEGGGGGAFDAPLRVAANVVAGYLGAGGPLTPAEQRMLGPLMGARVAISLVNGAIAARANPSNSEYLLATQKPGWRLLRLLQGLRESEVAAALLPPAVTAAQP
ncbi:hypothetical protein MNEG_1285 [Monoraphidium neglectum]|uniref:Hydroxylysine kinase n=1 Tax=Monoraphidium neglectum TaxID=145388 RepID=A0A0D2NQV3_9CHLO|nr:hypothetical protein MNEG_1285 [Monoraphidium neglectum]KIZ06671.1 hypothetical protein MNEG_1285 [Monoraphidium neglectum]|eukprot:XP_013905690.1 hypothetical protein MNEG_1285 [Monoraphidium neglectum]